MDGQLGFCITQLPITSSTFQKMALPFNLTSSRKFPSSVKQSAYCFDGRGNVTSKDWDFGQSNIELTEGVCWYHIELPRSLTMLSSATHFLIDILCPALSLQDILLLVSNGPFCGYIDGALIFRVNSAGPTTSKYTHRLAVRLTNSCVITVSLGEMRSLGFSNLRYGGLPKDILSLENRPRSDGLNCTIKTNRGDFRAVVIEEHVLDLLLSMNHSVQVDKGVPTCVSNLLVQIVDAHIAQLEDIITDVEKDLDATEGELDTGGHTMKKQILEHRLLAKMNLGLQRFLQVISQGEQVFPRAKEKCVCKKWLFPEDTLALDILVCRLQKLKENIGFLANRITALQADLDSWQSEQINLKLYYISVISVILLPLSITTSVFGMNVGGVPWVKQSDPIVENGFRNVLFICTGMLFILLSCFFAGPLYKRLTSGQPHQITRRKKLNGKKLLWKGSH
eukprot:c43338_g1_i1 orf=285-1637(-)